MFFLWFLLWAAAIGGTLRPNLALAAVVDSPKHVMVLHSYHQGLGWTDSITEGIEASFRASGLDIERHYEYMDTKRIYDDRYLADLAALLTYKYRNRRIDVMISSDDLAFRFLLTHHDGMFPETPVVFCGVNYFRDEFISGTPYFTGVVESFSITGTLDAALALQPEIRTVFSIVDDTVTGKANRKLLEDVIPRYEGRLQFPIITDKDMTEVQEIASRLPADSIVLLLSFTTDRSGNTFSLERSADLISRTCNRPIYSFWDFHLNHGVIGGMLTTGRAHGEKAAEMALKILGGVGPADIPVLKESPNRLIFDHTVLRKFNIPPGNLPEGSTVVNQSLTFYERHRWLVLQVFIAFAVLLFFTVVLAVNLFRRKTAEARLQTSETRLKAVFHAASDVSFIITDANDPSPVVLEFSPGAEKIFGYSRREMVGRPVDVLHLPEDVARFPEFHRRMREGKQGFSGEVWLRRKSGEIFPALFSAYPLEGGDGRMLGALGVSFDITEQKRILSALRDSESRFRDLAELLPETIYEIDPEGRVLYSNQSGFAQFDYTPEDLAKGFRIWSIIDPADKERLRSNIHRVLQGENIGLTEYTVVRRDGTRFPIITRASVIQEDGRPVGLRGFLIDISDRKRMEERYYEAQRMESIGTLAGGIAHDFNNLLMGVQGRADLLRMDMDPSDRRIVHLQGIEECVKSAVHLTRQLLGFARAGKYDPAASDVNAIIADTTDMFARTRKELRISQKFDDGPLTAVVDRGQIGQALLSLFVNAWQAMPGGGDLAVRTRRISLSAADAPSHEVTPGDYAVIEVADTGAGMDAKTRERIFEPFFSTKARGRGTGLGLAAAYGIIRNHHGAIRVSSEPGRGSTFTILLPLSPEAPKTTFCPQSPVSKGGETILLVDDEEVILSVTTELLGHLGYRVMTASGGREALTVYEARRNDIDLVILDMIMSDLSGKDTFERLKAMNPKVRVLLSTGYSIDGEAAEIMARGCDGFIQKPFDLSQLSLKIGEVLGRR